MSNSLIRKADVNRWVETVIDYLKKTKGSKHGC